MNMELPLNLLGFVQVYTGIMIYDMSIICGHNGVLLDIDFQFSLVNTACFLQNLHQVHPKLKKWKAKQFKGR